MTLKTRLRRRWIRSVAYELLPENKCCPKGC